MADSVAMTAESFRALQEEVERLETEGRREIAERSCVLCHSSMLITQQAKDSTGWAKTVALMEKWGAPVPPAQHDTLLAYLVRHLGPRPRR